LQNGARGQAGGAIVALLDRKVSATQQALFLPANVNIVSNPYPADQK
jgi:hypothetical protein